MTTSPVLDIQTAVATYIDAWNVSSAERVSTLDEVIAGDGYYCDGVAEAAGSEAIAAMIDATYEQFPGAGIELISPVDSHHQQARFDWRLHDGNGGTIVEGIDVVRFDESGRFTQVLGFFGTRVPNGDPSVETSR